MRENQQKGIKDLPMELTSRKPRERSVNMEDILNLHFNSSPLKG